MMQLDPIIAVKNVAASADWYGEIFGFRNAHGGDLFAVLNTPDGETVLCLHAWETHEHPTMSNPAIAAGNGLLLYFRTADWQNIRNRLARIGWAIEQDIHQNPDSRRQEFSFRDPDGYFITVTELHHYEDEG